MKNTVRDIIPQDLVIMESWFKAWNIPFPKSEDLPNNGLCGIVLERNKVAILIAMIYLTNSKQAYVSVISDPKESNRGVKEEYEMFISNLLVKIKQWGCTSVSAITKIDKVIEQLKDYGFSFTEKEYASGFCRLL